MGINEDAPDVLLPPPRASMTSGGMVCRDDGSEVSGCGVGERPAPPCAGMVACSARRCCGASDALERGSLGLPVLPSAIAMPCGTSRPRVAVTMVSAGVGGRPAPPFAGNSSRGTRCCGGAADGAGAAVSSIALSDLAAAVSGWLSAGREVVRLAVAALGSAVVAAVAAALGGTGVNGVA